MEAGEAGADGATPGRAGARGRRREEETWSHFTPTGSANSKGKQAQTCKYCTKTMSIGMAEVGRLRAHLLGCKDLQQNEALYQSVAESAKKAKREKLPSAAILALKHRTGELNVLSPAGRRGGVGRPPAGGFLVKGPPPTREQVVMNLRRANEVGKRAMALGRHPFGAVLVAPDQETVLAEQCNVDTVNHAEAVLARTAASNYGPDFLWACTLYTSVEPCCMCAGTCYWANIGRVVFGLAEDQLLAATGAHPENPTMSIPASYVFEHGQKAVDVIGPVEEVAADILELQRAFWASR